MFFRKKVKNVEYDRIDKDEVVEENKDVVEDTDVIEYIGDSETKSIKENSRYILNIVIDKNYSGIISFFKSNRLNVYKIYEDIEKIKNNIILKDSDEIVRTVIIETGMGSLNKKKKKEELRELLDMKDEDILFSIFYMNNGFMRDIMYKRTDEYIDKYEFKSMADVAVKLRGNNEEYIGYDEDDFFSEDVIMSYKALIVNVEEEELLVNRNVKSADIVELTGNNFELGEELEGFKIRI